MAGDLHDNRNSCRSRVSRALDLDIAALAYRQHSVVEQTQLLDLGMTRDELDYRLQVGRLHAVLPRVYAVGSRRLTAEGRMMAVVLWAGLGAVISHRSAAAFRGILRTGGPIHVTTPHRRTPRAGILLHHRHLPTDEITSHDGIPVTAVARTLLDIAATEGRDPFTRALRQAEYLQLADATPLPTLIARYPRARGTGIAAAALDERRISGHTESELEDRFVEFLAARGLPAPRANAWIEAGGERFRVDFLWPEEMVVVELDGRAAHEGDDRFESDRRRDLALMGLGYVVARVTWRRLHDDPDGLADELRALLDRRARRTGAERIAPGGRPGHPA